jgi:hypothetical protein
MKKLIALLAMALISSAFLSAQERDKMQAPFGNRRAPEQGAQHSQQQESITGHQMLPPPPCGGCPAGGHCPEMFIAADWANAWQAAREAKIAANKVTFYLISSSGPSIVSTDKNIFEAVSLKAFGTVLLVTVDKAQASEGGSFLFRANDLLRIELQNVK